MIYDTLNNLPNYLGVSDNLDTVIEYIMARDITTLPAGRTRIDGDKAVVTVSTVTPQTSDKALFQRHDNHITLETDLDGSELFEVSLAELTPTKPTDEAADTTVGLSLIHISVETPVVSSVGASSFRSAPMMLALVTVRMASSSCKKLTPPASGVPVPGKQELSLIHIYHEPSA